MELWDVYDSNRQKTGRTAIRGEKLQPGDYHMVVQVIIFNSEDRMLIQQRAHEKDGWADLWDVTAGGSALQGETSSQGAQRELFEEMGIAADLSHRRPHVSPSFESGFCDIYLLEEDIPLSALRLQKEEVQDARWATREEIHQMIDSGEFVSYYHSWIDFLFDSRKKLGTFRLGYNNNKH